MPYQAFLDAAVKEVESQLKNVDISTDGLQIYTTLDPEQQSYADKMLDTADIIDYPNDRFQAAFVFMDTSTGEVRAIGSGRKEYKATFRGSNFAIDMNRQPGSTFKPIFDYGPAIENLKWATSHIVQDAPTTYSNGTPIKNWNNDYKGDISIRTALQWSYNIPALNTLKQVGLDKARTFAEGLGITFDKDVVYESYAIGSNAVNPLEMAGAYGAFANDGMYTKPHFIRKIVFPDGKELSFEQKPQRAMSDYTAYMVTDMLRTVVDSGTGTAANVPSLDVAGKTGTTNFEKQVIAKFGYPSNATSDSWFVGYTPQYTMSVWTGYAQNGAGNYMVGNTQNIAKYIFKEMMRKFGNDNSAFAQPSSVVRQDDNELYVKGQMSDYVPVKADAPSGLQAKYNQEKKEISLSWSYPQSKIQNTTFNVNYSLDGGQSTALKTNTKDVALTLSNAKAGGRYTFSVTATSRGKTSSAATVTVVVPAAASSNTPNNNNNASNGENNSTNNGNNSTNNGNNSTNNGNNSANNGNNSANNGNNSANNGNNSTNNSGNSTNNEAAEPNNNTNNSNTNGENATSPSTPEQSVSEEDVGIPKVP
jgi:penicillin-binding protein 1A